MEFISLFVVTMSGAITFIGLNPPTIDTDCKNKKIYEQSLEYCTTGKIPPKFPKEFIGRSCEDSVIKRLKDQVNVCK